MTKTLHELAKEMLNKANVEVLTETGKLKKEEPTKVAEATPLESASAVATTVPLQPNPIPSGPPASIPVSFSKTGAYELVDIIRWAMPPASGETILPAGFQDYNRFKGPIENIQISDDRFNKYKGTAALVVSGKKIQPENITDQYLTDVHIFGPEVGAAGISLSTKLSPSIEVGPDYLRKGGLNPIPLSCFSEGRTPTNANALYLVQAPSKAPVYLTYSISTGSGGKWFTYTIWFGSIDWKFVPGATENMFDGTTQAFGSSPYKDFQYFVYAGYCSYRSSRVVAQQASNPLTLKTCPSRNQRLRNWRRRAS